MCNSASRHRIGGAALAWLLGACVSGGVHAQDDLPPLYQVEIIVFAYDELDPAEEVFQPVPTAADRRASRTAPAVPQRREPFRYEAPELEDMLRTPRGLGGDADGSSGNGALPDSGDGDSFDASGQAPADSGEGASADSADGAVRGRQQAPATNDADALDGADHPPLVDLEILPLQDLGPFGMRRLSPEALQLGDARATLERLSAYRPLVHVGWVQEGLPESEAVPFELAQLGRLTPTGTIQLHISEFQRLRLRVDLEYRPGGDVMHRPAELVSRFELRDIAPPPRFVLREDRVARPGELHYFDHPAFGVVAVVRPQERAPAEDVAVPMPAP